MLPALLLLIHCYCHPGNNNGGKLSTKVILGLVIEAIWFICQNIDNTFTLV